VSVKLPSGIDRLPSGKYRVRVPLEKLPTGRWRYGGGTFTHKKDAEARREVLIVAKQTGRVDQIDADLITLAELAAEHMQATQATLAENTYSTYRNLWVAHVVGRNRQGRHAIADMSLRAITPTTVEKFAADRLDAGAGTEAIRKLLAFMHSVFNRAVRDQRIDRNPVALVKKPPTKPKTRIVPTTPEEVEKLRGKLPDADAVLAAILAYTGIRPGEARGLQWSDLSERNVHVWRSVGPEGVKETKTTKTRSVPLCATLKADLNAWKRQLGSPSPESFILPRADGEPWTDDDFKNWQKRRFKTAVKAAGINLARPYDLRHSAASLWIAEGRNVVEVAAWLGHQPTETLKTYAHVIADRDPSDTRTVDDRILAARRDISVTYEHGKAGQTAVRRRTRKRRQTAVSGASA
jgi:integrase